ncbi:hypothetical protein BH09MYX1_BH09MYX1_63820 [soil metagenome]
MTSSRPVFVAILCASTLLGGRLALAAGPTAQDLETARVLYKEGKELRAKGDLKGAYPKLLAAHSLGHTPLTGIELAKVEVDLGLLVEAREVCLGIARMPVESDETKRSAEARDDAAVLAESIKGRIASLVIRIVSPPTHAELTVEVDDVRVPSSALTEPRRMNPGRHQIRAHFEGGEPLVLDVDVVEAQTKDVALSPPLPAVVIVPPPPPPPKTRPTASGLSGVTIAGFITAGVGLAFGGGGGIAAIAYKSGLNCGDAKACSGSDVDTLSRAYLAANISDVGFAVAGVGAVITIIGLLTTPSRSVEPSAKRSITPELGLGWVGVHGRF